MLLFFAALAGIALAQLTHVIGKLVGGAFSRVPLLAATLGPLTLVLEDLCFRVRGLKLQAMKHG